MPMPYIIITQLISMNDAIFSSLISPSYLPTQFLSRRASYCSKLAFTPTTIASISHLEPIILKRRKSVGTFSTPDCIPTARLFQSKNLNSRCQFNKIDSANVQYSPNIIQTNKKQEIRSKSRHAVPKYGYPKQDRVKVYDCSELYNRRNHANRIARCKRDRKLIAPLYYLTKFYRCSKERQLCEREAIINLSKPVILYPTSERKKVGEKLSECKLESVNANSFMNALNNFEYH